jgi:hypothetical protein
VSQEWRCGKGGKEAAKRRTFVIVKGQRTWLLAVFAALKQVCERSCNIGVTPNKTSVKVAKPKEYLDIVVALGLLPRSDGVYPAIVHRNPVLGNHKP